MPSSPSPTNHLKRKEPDSDSDPDPPSPKATADPTSTSSSSASSGGTATAPAPARPDEYEAGRVICEACGTGVSFRDDDSGGFTLKHWEAHRLTCPAASQRPPAPPIAYAPPTDPLSTHLSSSLQSNIPSSSSGPHAPKRRRAKRTEEERIEYLRADPYVGEFEAYRVLCASCDKWIRLRPNSTYCSIPWDAHRKSCLAKKITTKNPYALSERNTLFAKDPDVRKFDPERLLCNICDRWLSLPPDDHLGAVQRWLSHRAACGRAAGQNPSSVNVNANGTPIASTSGSGSPSMGANPTPGEGPDRRQPSASLSPRSPSSANPNGPRFVPPALPPAPGSSNNNTAPPALTTSNSSNPNDGGASSSGATRASPPSPYLLTPLTYAPAHESRRRNAEQRAATLRADRLIGRVEPNRVFCSLCEKWVQLRQDSSYCAYPWVQHRGKCLRRSERRNAKAAELAQIKGPPSTSSYLATRRPIQPHPSRSSHSHSTHPSQSSSSHSSGMGLGLGMGLGYPSAHQHHQQRHHVNGHASVHNGSKTVHGGHGHGRRGGEDEDQLMSEGEGERGPLGLSASPSVSMSEEESGEHDAGGRTRPKERVRRHTVREGDVDGEEEEEEEGGEGESDEEDVKPRLGANSNSKDKDALNSRRAHEMGRRAQHGGPTSNHANATNSSPNGHRNAHRPRVSHGYGGGATTPGRMSHAVAAGQSYRPSSSGGRGASSSMGMAMGAGGQRGAWDGEDADAEGEPDADAEAEAEAEWLQEMEGNNGVNAHAAMNRGVPRRPWPVGLADLDSASGRKHFIQASITHLFGTTYEPASDELSVSALLTYLNAAMPPDKHEDFDTTEVARAVAALAERGKVVFEGDIVRVVE